MEWFPENLKLSSGPLVRKPGIAQIRNIMGMKAQQDSWAFRCVNELRKMPNLVKHRLPEMPKDPWSFTETKVDQGPSQGMRALIGSLESMCFKEDIFNHISAEDEKFVIYKLYILYDHNCKNNHTERKMSRK